MFANEYRHLRPNNQHLKSLDSAGIEAIAKGINARRLATYRQAVESDAEALALYGLNARLPGLLLETVGGFEIVLRNAVSDVLADHFQRSDWYRARAFTKELDIHRRRNIRDARKNLQERGRGVDADRVVTERNFHFWVALHERKYRIQFWVPFLRKIWPDGQDPKRVHKDLSKVRDLRNRIAHHEPVFAPKWRECSDLILSRIEQLSPEQHA